MLLERFGLIRHFAYKSDDYLLSEAGKIFQVLAKLGAFQVNFGAQTLTS